MRDEVSIEERIGRLRPAALHPDQYADRIRVELPVLLDTLGAILDALERVADERDTLAAQEAARDALAEEWVMGVLKGYRLSWATDEDGGPLTLVDALSFGETNEGGLREIDILADDIVCALTDQLDGEVGDG